MNYAIRKSVASASESQLQSSITSNTDRSSQHQASPRRQSFNHDLLPSPSGSDRSDAHGFSPAAIPTGTVYTASFQPLAPAIDRTPTYEKGPLKVAKITSGDWSGSSKAKPSRKPTRRQSPPVWYTRTPPLRGGQRPIEFEADPNDDVFAPQEDQVRSQKVPPVDSDVLNQASPPYRAKGTPLPKIPSLRKGTRERKSPERFGSVLFGGMKKIYKDVTKKGKESDDKSS